MNKIIVSLALLTLTAAWVQAAEPDRITVQHILISFKGAIDKPGLTRTRAEAEALANGLLERIKKGEDFAALVKGYTDDQNPGIYSMSNFNVKPDPTKAEYPRDRMVKAFGDVGFSLKVGEVGLASYDQVKSPFGWHIIKRLQ